MARSEKAIDAMAAHINSLTTQLQVAQMQGGGGVVADSSETVALIRQLQDKVTDLEAQLSEEKEESSRRDEEVIKYSRLELLFSLFFR